MSAEFISRIIGMILAAIGGCFLGLHIAGQLGGSPYQYAAIFLLIGALVGLVLTPYVTVRPFVALRKRIRQAPAHQLLAATLGLVIGLIVAALLAFPLSLLPPPFSQILPFVAAVLFGGLGIMVMIIRQRDIFNAVRGRLPGRSEGLEEKGNGRKPVLLDTSVIIDGRIADISRTGFIEGEMLVPRFVLNELQHIADSPDALRRNRGRRGLDMLRRLQSESTTPVRITDMDIEGVHEVDDKLVLLAKKLRCPIVTNDYNLNRVAELQGVRVLNINELANAVKAVFLPGESLTVKIIQEGKEAGQGVGYLDDGTMVVVEDGEPYINRKVEVVVTKVLQTAAGRMLFARLTR
ncbi:MAG: PIN domain nuclease [Chloroflexi bacterium]|nr:MAG: PIN domain nuclease [Chloroflexota bacterium]RLC85073.1 MAG: PIN domain nuclease [Chloroflexota bacterium]HEY67089.1 TRAM domain-containing protein [Thermoflexia bacterium]